jgi:hypothetical protein
VTWVAGGTALLVAAVGVGDTVLVNAGRGEHDTGATHVQPLPDDAAGDGEAAIDAPSPTTRPVVSGRTVGPTPTTTRSDVAAPKGDAFPERSACALDTRAMAAGETRACQFTANAAGGAHESSNAPAQSNQSTEQLASGQVYVTRNGARTLAWRSDECGVDAHVGKAGVFAGECFEQFIRPGDRVEVVLTKKTPSDIVVTLGAGKDW